MSHKSTCFTNDTENLIMNLFNPQQNSKLDLTLSAIKCHMEATGAFANEVT